MTELPILFGTSLEELRRMGARGGRAYGRNCRARRRSTSETAPATMPLPILPPLETTAEAIL